MDYFFTYLQSNLIEVTFVAFFLRRTHSVKSVLIFVSLMNSLTHPWVFFGWMGLPSSYLVNILLAEAFAMVAETFIYQHFLKIGWQRAFQISSLANLLSWQLGPALTWFVFHSGIF